LPMQLGVQSDVGKILTLPLRKRLAVALFVLTIKLT
jgi:hypothetical protein